MKEELAINVSVHEIHPIHTVESLNNQYLNEVAGRSKKQPVAVVIDGDLTAKQRAAVKK